MASHSGKSTKKKSSRHSHRSTYLSSCSLGVSCDACMISNFPGRRYKCLLCDNYDLCGNCYDSQSESQNHKSAHPMQCMLTEAFAGF